VTCASTFVKRWIGRAFRFATVSTHLPQQSRDPFSSRNYAFGELTAEMNTTFCRDSLITILTLRLENSQRAVPPRRGVSNKLSESADSADRDKSTIDPSRPRIEFARSHCANEVASLYRLEDADFAVAMRAAPARPTSSYSDVAFSPLAVASCMNLTNSNTQNLGFAKISPRISTGIASCNVSAWP
jgi:hypothetical protein